MARDVRSVVRALAAALIGLISGAACIACVVTSTPTITGPDICPPVFLTTGASPPVGGVVVMQAPATVFEPSVDLSSCATSQTFEVRVLLDGVAQAFERDPTGADSRSVQIPTSLLGLQTNCLHTIEWYASSHFAPGEDRVPVTPGDITYAAWSVDIDDGSSQAVKLTCR